MNDDDRLRFIRLEMAVAALAAELSTRNGQPMKPGTAYAQIFAPTEHETKPDVLTGL